jgi:hypothetical protein
MPLPIGARGGRNGTKFFPEASGAVGVPVPQTASSVATYLEIPQILVHAGLHFHLTMAVDTTLAFMIMYSMPGTSPSTRKRPASSVDLDVAQVLLLPGLDDHAGDACRHGRPAHEVVHPGHQSSGAETAFLVRPNLQVTA